jgi:DNA repair exonuclease SbcCD nuclease subunit
MVKIKKKILKAYPGSLIQQDFGESVSNHGYLLWDVKTKTPKEINIDSKYGFYKFKLNSITNLDDNSEQLLNL